MSEVTELYDRDVYAWTQDQAARTLARQLEQKGHRDTKAALAAFTATTPYFDLDRELLDPDWFPRRD